MGPTDSLNLVPHGSADPGRLKHFTRACAGQAANWSRERRSAARDVRRWGTWSLSVSFVRRRFVCACVPACASSHVSRPRVG